MTHTRHPAFRSLPRRAHARATCAAVVLMACACGPDAPSSTDGTIDREVFIATYVDLRIAALESEPRTLSGIDRDAVLARHSVTEEALMTFAEVHGRDVEFMSDVWEEVELRLDAAQPQETEIAR